MGILTKALLTSTLTAMATAAIASPAAPAAPFIQDVVFSGTSCFNDSLNHVDLEGNRIKVSFAEFNAMVGGPDDPLNRFVNCATHLTFVGGVPGFALSAKKVSGEGTFYATPKVALSLFATMFWETDPAVS